MKLFRLLTISYFLINICLAQNISDSTLLDCNRIIPNSSLLYLRSINNLPLSERTINLRTKINPLDKKINYYYLSGMVAAGTGTILAIRNYYANTWWKDKSTGFKFTNDWNYALWVDKFGHFFATYALSNLISNGLDAANLQEEDVFIYSSLTAWLFQTYVEIEDGYGPNWGFSPGDAIANTLGAGYRLAQYYYPVLRNVLPKFSYYPSEEFRNGEKEDHNMSDDYEGQKLWLSFRMKNILPNSISKHWPSILMLSAGYAVRNLDGSGGGERHFLLALDIDLEAIPLHGKFWNFFKNTFNLVHFPMPGIRITPHGTYFEIIF